MRFAPLLFRGVKGIAQSDGKRKTLSTGNLSTSAIIKAIMDADKASAQYTNEFSQSIPVDNVDDLCRFLFDFVRKNVKYVEDNAEQIQLIKSPAALITTGFGDCKSMSIFCASVLKNLDIPYVYRFVSQDRATDLHHVYLWVDDRIALDCTVPDYNTEATVVKVKDVAPTEAKIAGIIPLYPIPNSDRDAAKLFIDNYIHINNPLWARFAQSVTYDSTLPSPAGLQPAVPTKVQRTAYIKYLSAEIIAQQTPIVIDLTASGHGTSDPTLSDPNWREDQIPLIWINAVDPASKLALYMTRRGNLCIGSQNQSALPPSTVVIRDCVSKGIYLLNNQADADYAVIADHIFNPIYSLSTLAQIINGQGGTGGGGFNSSTPPAGVTDGPGTNFDPTASPTGTPAPSSSSSYLPLLVIGAVILFIALK